MQKLDVLVACDMCVDLLLSGNVRPQFSQVEQIIGDYALELGGSAGIFAAQLAKLGSRVGAIGKLGQDFFGSFVLQKLKEAGVELFDVETGPQYRTGLSTTLVEYTDRSILTFLGTIADVHAKDLPADPGRVCRHWHIASYFILTGLRPHWEECLRRCQQSGVSTSLDTNWDPEDQWTGVRDTLRYVDVFLPNEAEALAITGESDVLRATRHLASLVPTVVVKRGAEGSLAIHNGRVWEHPPADISFSIVDSVGAGDNFDAGFLHAWLRGDSMTDCLSLADRCAVSSLGKAGGVAGQLKLL